ncbi:hypothetical protein FB45DRAFT_912056 [Roridomyces roridus]|uniref:Phosphoglucomutase n=1 Tax=Roridomyces roridus TaxID=1738132 RepID=A0AAD7BW41_9AGAR|nr:hypothetical protein FB45DRAFT_912056 [Roridomyces roridus]
MMTSLESLVNEWLRLDKNESTRAEIQRLWDQHDTDELESRLRSRIEFGTAGLRGRMAAGWANMNDLIIVQTSQGLRQYVENTVENATSRGVVIGHDHRHNSARWAQLTAAVFVQAGWKVYLLRGLVHTPLVPFSVQALGAATGVMITASHNPKDDNGYKVYWENAVQIIAPHDKGISVAIKANLEPQTSMPEQLTSCLDRTEEMKDAYFANLAFLKFLNQTTKAKFVNTSMHGVSDKFVSRAFQLFGFPPYIPVLEQQQPDPEFPTVAFPNPEEKGALDLALKTADAQGASYVLSQDPDSDRFCAAEKQSNGQWIVFTGDQLGTLFAAQVLKTYKESGKPIDKLAMVASTVSSKMIEAMAEKEGFKFVECLTGFKFIGNTALTLVSQGFDVPFGYEEAIGYMFGSTIRDKDGVAATMVFCQLVASLVDQTVFEYLGELYKTYGYFQTSNSYFVCKDPRTIDLIFARLRSYPDGLQSKSIQAAYPRSIGGLQITSVLDLTKGYGYDSSNAPTYEPSLPLSSGHMIQFRALNETDGTKIVLTIRTSGTEPKIKYYLAGSWMEAEKHHLGRP